MPTITHNGLKLAYDSRGKGRPAFVFIHGWTCDRSFFAPQVKHFARRQRVATLNQRAYRVAFSPDGRTLVTGGKDGSIVMWDPASWRAMRILRDPPP